MILKLLLLLSILLQVIAAVIAVRLMSRTKYNFSWIMFSVALTLMALMLCGEYARLSHELRVAVPADLFVWLGVTMSLCLAVGMFYVRKIFNYTDRLNFQRKLTEKRILSTVLRTEEKERLRFSKELHDGLGPLLSSARMSLSALKMSDESAENRALVENTGYVIEEAIRSLKEISNNLSPHTLSDFGLGRGISNFIARIPSKKMTVDFTTNLRDERFDTDVEVILYRVVCELVNNSLKHSGGTRIDASLTWSGESLRLEYRDDGRGFDPAAMMTDVGLGLSNITSRISSLKGGCTITSERGGGMRALIVVDTKP